MREKRIAILGATGVVGQEMIRILEERQFPIGELIPLCSERSVGKSIRFCGEDIPARLAERDAFAGVDVVLGAAPAETARRFAADITEAGAVFIDNSSAFRLMPHVPLVIPFVNPQDAKGHSGILANPNCVTIITLTAVYAIDRLSPIRRMWASTYQAVSGAGAGGMDALTRELAGEKDFSSAFPHPIAGNLLPKIGEVGESGYTAEEMKLVNESRKILHREGLPVSCMAVRVPIMRCHSVSVTVETEHSVSLEAARAAIAKAKGCILADNTSAEKYPMPLFATGRDEVFVGRIRRDTALENGLSLFCAGDQLRRGAAANAVDIMELI